MMADRGDAIAVDGFKFNTKYSFLYDHFGIACLTRMAIIIYGEFHDNVFHLNYTDVDYHVFSDAAQWVSLGKSPYNRDGYRYTPILSYMLLPNMSIHHAFGKVLFCAMDIFAAYLTFVLLQRMKLSDEMMKLCVLLALYNPVQVNVSTRGNAESVMSVLCLATLHLHQNLRFFRSGLMFGLSVHFKIYPICYALPLYFWCSRPLEPSATKVQKVVQLLKPTWEKGLFVAGSVFAFVALTGLFYGIYGMEFLRETYLYHLTRRDVQHNFSPYFYILRMTKGSPHEQLINLLPFIPQLVLWTAFSWAFYTDLPFVCFLNTAVFVILNKVCTVQYFMWYLTFLPLVIPSISLPRQRIIYLILAWFSSMAFWLGSAYLLEFRQRDIVFLVWVASLAFMATNVAILFTIVAAYHVVPLSHSDTLPLQEKKDN